MYITASEIVEVEYGFLHDALLQISRIIPSFRACYMDKGGELALRFDAHLSEDDIKGVLFELYPFGPYSAAPEGPSGEEVKYHRDYVYSPMETETEVYSRDGIDYRTVDEKYQY